jgi:hypothetical protein
MENPRQTPQEVREGGEPTETPELQQLNDATHTPEAYVEQIGDFHEAESIQNNLVVLVEDSKAAEKAVSAVAPHVPGQADASQATASPGESGGGAVDAIPITVPDVRTSGGEASTLPVPLPSPSAGEASSLPVPIPSPAPEAADEGSSLPVPIPSPTRLEPPAVRGDLDQAESATGTPPGGDEATPINLPDVQAVRGTGPESAVKSGDRTAVEAAGGTMQATPITLPGQGENTPPMPSPEEGEGTGGEETAGTDTVPAAEEETKEGGEWTPPDWYIAIGPDGVPIVVDKDGNPVESPPQVQTVNPADGTPCNPMVYYQDGSQPVELPYYTASLQNHGYTVFVGPDGKAVVIDAYGNPLACQPVIQTVDENGQPCEPMVHFSGAGQEAVELPYYDDHHYLIGCSILVGADGKAVLVDEDGKPTDLQPFIQTVDENGQPCEPKVSLRGDLEHMFPVSYFSKNLLDGCSVHTGADGKPVVVDAFGKPLDVQPVIQTTNPDGSPCEPKAYYPGSTGEPVNMSYYSANLGKCFLHTGADGKPVVVDANGNPLASQPVIQTVDEKGQPCEPKIYYQGGEENPVSLSAYSAPLDGCSVHIAADGKATVVDADGKPLASQPIIQTVNPADGKPCPPTAYYKDAGGNPVELPYYTGPKKIDKP